MKKRGLKGLMIILALSLIFLPVVLASSIDSEIQKATHYAEEYETGNIDYIQLLVYMSSVRGKINELLGTSSQEFGGILKQEQIKNVLGEPNEETKWVWVENEERERKLDESAPIWKKIIFDGNKIQIRLNAFPSIFKKMKFDEEFGEESEIEAEKGEGELVYRLMFQIDFKKPQEQLNIQGKIDEIKVLAEAFNSNPSNENAEALAQESVNAEKTFQSYFQQNQGKCEDIMKSIFGSENQRQTQQLLVQEISLVEGDNFEAIARLEMCDDCEWNWINLDFWFEGRGPGFKPPKETAMEEVSSERYKNMDSAGFKTEVKNTIEEIIQSLQNGEYARAFSLKSKLWQLNEAWNQRSNDVWQEIDKSFKSKQETLAGEELQKFHENYGWIKEEQERRQKEKELRKTNYEERKQFYSDLFSGYEKKEYYFSQIEFEKRLIEEFREFGEEICNNNVDDNKNEQVDCQDEQCGGKICGETEVEIVNENETSEQKREMFCIQKTCQLKEEIISLPEIICGNHICEGNETTENCAEDCSLCPQYPPIECAGRVIFSGTNNETGCSLEPICIEENETCVTNENCQQPLCGRAECIEGTCQTITLEECRESECSDGQEKIQNCESGEDLVTEKCVEGLWVDTGIECQVREGASCEESCASEPHILCIGQWDISGTYPNCNCNFVCGEEEISGDECTVREDCGGENDVCSNGKCTAIPEAIQIEPITIPITEPTPTPEPEESSSEPETTIESSPEQESEPTITGEIIKTIKTITGFIITGLQTEEPAPEPGPEPSPEQGTEEPPIEQPPIQPPEEHPPEYEDQGQERFDNNQEDRREERFDEERDDRGDGERERNEQEQKERCKQECNRPCIEKCIRQECGEKMECDVDEVKKKCEGECQPEENCIEKCMQGGDWWKEFEQKDEHKEEKGVFQAGGNCRTSQGKTEGFIWFGGWGEPFEQIQPLKQKYYSGGDAQWCKNDLENLLKRRKEFENGFNQNFVIWFFEKYLANSAEDWEQHISGIFELYWNNVDTMMEIAHRMNCLEITELADISPINIKYETEYGSFEYWEEIKPVKVPGMDRELTIVSPYMKLWIFPPKSFIVYEMKQAMKNHEFPGPPEDKMERKNEEGLTAQEKQMIKQDRAFMEKIKTITEKYGGNLQAVIQFKDYETNPEGEVVFNLYAQVNENDIIKIEPMLPEEAPTENVKVEIDFKNIYELIYSMEKDMQGEHLESPPWDRKLRPIQKVKEVVNGVKMYFKIRSIMNSAKFYPAESEDDMKFLFKEFFSMMKKGEGKRPPEGMEEMTGGENGEGENIEEDLWDSKEKITGEVIVD